MPIDLPETIAGNIKNFTGRAWLLPKVLDWLENSAERLLILEGEPGSGKSMVAAWLADTGAPAPAEAEDRQRLERIRAQVKAIHFCTAASGNTSPKALARSLAGQLQERIPAFDQALANTLREHVQILNRPEIGSVAAGASVVGIQIENLNLGGLGDELSFDRILREPLIELYKTYSEPALILIDALDEALTYTGELTIPRLLAKLSDLPTQVRFLVTTRPDPRVLKNFRNDRKIDLIMNAPPDQHDVQDYVDRRLKVEAEGKRAGLAERIGQAAEGNFLYAHLVLEDLLPRLHEIQDLEQIPLPQGLSGVYQDFLNRELGADEERWYESFRPVLGLVSVGQGHGLTQSQMKRYTGREVEPVLRACKQFLDGDLPEGPFRPFHRSFADFLLEDENNLDYRVDPAQAHLLIADAYCPPPGCQGAWSAWDDYGMRYTPVHLVKAAQEGPAGDPLEPVRRLVRLASDRDYQADHLNRVKDPVGLQNDLELALRAAADHLNGPALPLLVSMALALERFRRQELHPRSIFELARQGEVEQAEQRLALFEIDQDWRQAALLALAWLGGRGKPEAAKRIQERMKEALPADGPLPLILARLLADVEGQPMPPLPPLPEPPPIEVAEAIVRRMSGQGADTELLIGYGMGGTLAASEPASGSRYFAEQDGPPLVSFAAAYPVEGDELFRQYLGTHTRYNYVQYRNRSLWLLLEAALRHPDSNWVLEFLPAMAEAALIGNTLEFQESLPITVLALGAATGQPGALQSFETQVEGVVTAAEGLPGFRRMGDTWGRYKRRLLAAAEAMATLLGKKDEAVSLLEKALSLPYGLAGFQAPACLALAEAFSICQPDSQEGVQQALLAARQAAHNIQDATFCARTTARYNALAQRWWKPEGFDPVAAVQRLRQEPSTEEFSALHIIGEPYQERQESGGLRLPGWVRQADTLETLAAVYQRPLGEFERLNPELRQAVDEKLEPGTPVNVPDPGFATWLAARFAARALADPALSAEERRRAIQALLPAAAPNPTILDTVLARLLLAARPVDPARLASLQELAARRLGEIDQDVDFQWTPGIPG